MIEKAFIAGGIGKAVYVDDGRWYMTSAEGNPIECRAGDIALLEDSGAEITELSADGLDADILRTKLAIDEAQLRALTLTLAVLDGDLSEETRALCCEAAAELMKRGPIAKFVGNRLLSKPLPEEADLRGAIEIAARALAEELRSFYSGIKVSQTRIRRVAAAWLKASQEIVTSGHERLHLEKYLIDNGVFADFVSVLSKGEHAQAGAIAKIEERHLGEMAQEFSTQGAMLLTRMASLLVKVDASVTVEPDRKLA